MKTQLAQEKEKISNEQTAATLRQEFELEFARKRLDLDKLHDDKTLFKYQIDSTERIYQRLGIKEIKINQFTGDSKTSLANILPQMGYALGQLNSVNQWSIYDYDSNIFNKTLPIIMRNELAFIPDNISAISYASLQIQPTIQHDIPEFQMDSVDHFGE